MLGRINKTVSTNIKLTNGYMWVLLRHNLDCTNKWRKKEFIICWIYKNKETFDRERVEKLEFDNYRKFKLFKDLIISARA